MSTVEVPLTEEARKDLQWAATQPRSVSGPTPSITETSKTYSKFRSAGTWANKEMHLSSCRNISAGTSSALDRFRSTKQAFNTCPASGCLPILSLATRDLEEAGIRLLRGRFTRNLRLMKHTFDEQLIETKLEALHPHMSAVTWKNPRKRKLCR